MSDLVRNPKDRVSHVVAHFQVKLLKEGKEIPPELEEQMREGKMKEAQGKEEVEGLNAELQTLRDKVMGIHS